MHSAYADTLDITRVPFSDRESRLLLLKNTDNDQFYIKLARRPDAIQPGIDTYRFRPPAIQDLTSSTRRMLLALTWSPILHPSAWRPGKQRSASPSTRVTPSPSDCRMASHRAFISVGTPDGNWRDGTGGSLKGRRAQPGLPREWCRAAQRTGGGHNEAYLVEFAGVQAGEDLAIHLGIRSDLALDGLPVPFSVTLAAAGRAGPPGSMACRDGWSAISRSISIRGG